MLEDMILARRVFRTFTCWALGDVAEGKSSRLLVAPGRPRSPGGVGAAVSPLLSLRQPCRPQATSTLLVVRVGVGARLAVASAPHIQGLGLGAGTRGGKLRPGEAGL